MYPIVIGSPRRHWAVTSLVAAALAALGIALIVAVRAVTVGWIALVVGGAGALFGAWQFYDARPRLIIDDRGILDRTFGIGLIPWSDIADVHLKSIQGRPQLCLDLRETKKYTSRLPQMMQRVVALNRQLGLTDLTVNLTGLTTDPRAVESSIRARLQASGPPSV